MNTDKSVKILLIGFAVIGALAILIPVSVGEDVEMNLDLADCKKLMGRIAKRTLKQFGICTKELRVNVSGNLQEFERRLGCALKCTLNKLELLNEEGKVTKERIQNLMDKWVPEEAHEFGHAITADCNQEFVPKLDPEEETCQSYSDYVQCMQGTLADVADKTGCHPGGTLG